MRHYLTAPLNSQALATIRSKADLIPYYKHIIQMVGFVLSEGERQQEEYPKGSLDFITRNDGTAFTFLSYLARGADSIQDLNRVISGLDNQTMILQILSDEEG